MTSPYRTPATYAPPLDIHSPIEMRAECVRRLAADLGELEKERPPWWWFPARRRWQRKVRWLAMCHNRDLQNMLNETDDKARAIRADLIGWWPDRESKWLHSLPGVLRRRYR